MKQVYDVAWSWQSQAGCRWQATSGRQHGKRPRGHLQQQYRIRRAYDCLDRPEV